jgi:hypothetical protein
VIPSRTGEVTVNGEFGMFAKFVHRHARIVEAAIGLSGLLLRIRIASDVYLSPDEAAYYWTANQRDLMTIGNFSGWARITHPPLFTFLLHGLMRFGHSELMLRSIPILAGVIFPWVVMQWVERFSSRGAGLSAQLLLTFSPELIQLSTEVRAYTLALLFSSLSVLLLEQALDRRSSSRMILSCLALYLAMLTEYAVLWIVAASGAYALVRLATSKPGRSLAIVWLLGEVGALSIFLVLFAIQASTWNSSGMVSDAVNGWLRTAFLQPGQRVVSFVAVGLLKQFAYLLGNRWLGVLAAAAYSIGLWLLWKREKRTQAAFLALPFGLACLGGVLHLYPFAATRHTAPLTIFAAAGIAIAVSAVGRDRSFVAGALTVILMLVANLVPEQLSYLEIPAYRNRLSLIRESIEFLRRDVPGNAIVVTDRGTSLMLGYYLGSTGDLLYSEPYQTNWLSSLRTVAADTFQFGSDNDLQFAIAETRRRYRWDGPVWVAAGGFVISVTNPAADKRPFEVALAVFESPR